MNDIQNVGANLSEDLIFIYFIEVHDEIKNFQLSLSNNSEIKTSDIELLKEHKFSYQEKFNYIAKVYRFNISNYKNEFEISVKFIEEAENKNEYIRKITNKDMGESKRSHIFLYDFTALDKNHNNFFALNSNDIPLNHGEQFQLYLNSLKEKITLTTNSKENMDLIQSISHFFNEKDKYDFKFYISVFIQSINTELINKHLISFSPKNLTCLGEFNNEELQSYKEIINKITEDPEIILKSFTEEYKSKASTNLYTIILYFNLKFQKEKLNPIFKGKHELFHTIFSSNFSLFEVLDLNEIKVILSLPNDCVIFLFIVNICGQFILNKFNKKIEKNEEIEKSKFFIQADEYVTPKKNDKIEKIFSLINNIIDFQKDNNKQFISFSPSFFEKLIEANKHNLENLLILKDTINKVKLYDKSYKKSLNYTQVDKSLENSIKTMEANYVKNWDSYNLDSSHIKDYFKKNENYLEYIALKGIEKNKIDQKFIDEWKEKNFKNKEHEKFIEKACSKVNNLNQFKILFIMLTGEKEGDSYKKKH